jgi:hypothetical protein
MALSFEDEIRALLHQRAEQNPTLHRLASGETTLEAMGEQDAFELIASVLADHTKVMFKIAKEIDALRGSAAAG